MEKEDLIQTTFLGFIIAVFFKLFDFISLPLFLAQDQVSYSLNLFLQFFLTLSLIAIVFFVLGYEPKIMRIEDEELIQYFKKIVGWCFVILFLMFLFFLFFSPRIN